MNGDMRGMVWWSFEHAMGLDRICPVLAGAEESEELLKQYVQDSLILKSSGGGSKLYDQYVLK